MQDDVKESKNGVTEINNPKGLTQLSCERKTITYQGPIPLPDMFEGYKRIQEDFPERIMRMAENEDRRQSDERRIEEKQIDGIIMLNKRRQIFTFITVIVCFGLFVTLILMDKDIASVGPFIVGALVAISGLFSKKDKDEEPEKSEKK